MKLLKIESIIAMIVFLLASFLSFIFGILYLEMEPYLNTGMDYFKIAALVIGFALAAAFNMIYYFYLSKEETDGYYYPKEENID